MPSGMQKTREPVSETLGVIAVFAVIAGAGIYAATKAYLKADGDLTDWVLMSESGGPAWMFVTGGVSVAAACVGAVIWNARKLPKRRPAR